MVALPEANVAIGRFEVTVEEWRVFAEAKPDAAEARCTRRNWQVRDWRNTGYIQTSRHPVVCVSWNEAQAYAEWVSLKTGHQYRLPTEAEWDQSLDDATRASIRGLYQQALSELEAAARRRATALDFSRRTTEAPDGLGRVGGGGGCAGRRVPLVLAGVALAGYMYAAGELVAKFLETVWLATAVVITYGMVSRRVLVSRRTLAFRQRRERAQAEDGETAEPLPDLGQIDADTRRLIRTLTTAGALAGASLVWSDMVPAQRLQGQSSRRAATGESAPAVPLPERRQKLITSAVRKMASSPALRICPVPKSSSTPPSMTVSNSSVEPWRESTAPTRSMCGNRGNLGSQRSRQVCFHG